MAISISLFETLANSVAGTPLLADSLGGGGTGTDLGQVTNGSFAPITPPQGNNVGGQDWFFTHDAAVDQITDTKIFIADYAVSTGFTYGGPATRSSAADFASLKALGLASGSSKTNADGLSGGIWTEMKVLDMIAVTTQFDQASNPSTVKIYGDNTTDGTDLANSFTIAADAMVISTDQSSGGDATDGFLPTAPVAGSVGINNDTVLGDTCHLRHRIFLPTSFSDGGIHQLGLTIAFTFTAALCGAVYSGSVQKLVESFTSFL